MSLAAGIFDFLSTGLSVGDRVYPLTLPQDVTLPALTFQVISDIPTLSHDVAQDHPLYTGARRSDTRVQFDCYGSTYDDAEALADELHTLAVGYRGFWGAIEVDSVLPDNRLDDRDEAPDVWRVICDLIIGHRTAAGS
jgi:hypothetical protein